MKTTSTLILRNSLLLFATLFTLSSFTAKAQTKLAAPRITQAIDESNLVRMQGKVHPLARPEFDRGAVADSQPMNRMLLVLKRSDPQEAALRGLMDEQQTKKSANYHAWLTPAQFGQQFGVADADVQKITAWLAQKGFTGIKPSSGNMFIEFSGTAGLVRNAFHTEIHNFTVRGEAHMANVSVPQIPAALAPVVQTVHSLHNFRKKSFMHFSKALEAAKAKAGPNLTYSNLCPNPNSSTPGTQPCGALAPADFAKIYNLPPALDGTGQTIALVARSNVTLSDITQFGTVFGVPSLTSFSYANNVVLTGPDPGIVPGDDAEATLDVEWSAAVAPNAKILLVVSDNQVSVVTDGADLSAFYIVNNNLAPIVSESFGLCEFESSDGFDNALWEQAAAQGITVMVATGDTGSASCDPDVVSGPLFTNASDAGLQVSGTASTPFNVAVGGTDFDDAANPSTYWNAANGTNGLSVKSYIPEITWNGGCASTATAGTLNSVCTGIDLNPQPPDDPSPDLAGGGGGQSNCGIQDVNFNCISGYPKPVWQQLTGLTGMPADSVRDIPDVSLFSAVNTASNNFYIICLADSLNQNGQPCSITGANASFSGVGGTSVASPAFAGVMALVNQSEVTATRLKAGEGQGNVNYVLYQLAVAQNTSPGTSACNSSLGPGAISTACTFNDITKGNNSVPCVGSYASPNVLGLTATPNCSTATAGAIGVLVEPSSPAPFSATTPGFTATTGYDLTTGLGSVNASNLVANWGNVTMNYKSSTATITSTVPASLTAPALSHGSNATFNISVTSLSGTPTGDVSLILPVTFASNFAFVNTATLSGGTAQIITDQLPGGTYQVVVHYTGDGTFASSDSAPVTVTVSKENSGTTVAMLDWTNYPISNAVPVTTEIYGGFYVFRVDVIGSQSQDAQQCGVAAQNNISIPCPTGNVTLTRDGGTPLNDFLNTATGVSTNTAVLNPLGFAEDRILGSTGLTGGTHTIVAAYAGDSSYNASTSPAASVTITAATALTSVTANGSTTPTVKAGQAVTLVAGVGGCVVPVGTGLGGGCNQPSTGAGPTGSVTFSVCGTASSCTVTVVPTAAANTNNGAFATATLPTTFTTVGTQTITATFTTADTNYLSCLTAACEIGNAVVTVSPAGTFAVSYSPQPLVLSSATGAAATETVTVTLSNGFTGMVAVTPTAASLPPGVTCTPSPLNINVTGTTAVNSSLMCQVTATSTTLTAANTREDRTFEAQAIAPPKTIPPTKGGKGWWALSAGTGFAALFLFLVPGGRKKYRAALGLGLICLLAFTLGCNGVNSGGGGTKTATVTKLTVTNGAMGRIPTGTAFTFSVAVTGGTPTGMVELFDGGTMIGAAATVSGGAATLTAPSSLPVGTHAISTHYLGDTTTLASSSGTLNLTVTGTTTIAITTTPAATPVAPAISVTIQ